MKRTALHVFGYSFWSHFSTTSLHKIFKTNTGPFGVCYHFLFGWWLAKRRHLWRVSHKLWKNLQSAPILWFHTKWQKVCFDSNTKNLNFTQKITKVVNFCKELMVNPACSILHLVKVIGCLISCFISNLYYHSMEGCKVEALRSNNGKWDKSITLDNKCLHDLKWVNNLSNSVVPISDICNYGWGMVVNRITTNRHFSSAKLNGIIHPAYFYHSLSSTGAYKNRNGQPS